MKQKRRALLNSAISLLLCFSMLVGTTFAWFTDRVYSANNLIATGVLDVEMEYLDADGNWTPVNETTEVLNKNALWEPGYAEVAYLKISNVGDLALKYGLGIRVIGETGSINKAGEPFNLSDYIQFGVIESDTEQSVFTSRAQAVSALTQSTAVSTGYAREAVLYPETDKDVHYATLVVYMPEEVGNAANYATGATPPVVQLGIQLVATQTEYESDSFGTDYDADVSTPGFNFPSGGFGGNVSADVTTDGENKVAADVTIMGTGTNAVIPAGVQLEDGTDKLTLEVSTVDQSEANITLGKNEEIRALNVHVQGVSVDNTVPMEIYLKEAAAKGLNAGNLKLYHVENGTTVEMTAVDTFTAHNQFKYDPATGDITLYMATFSEVAVVADTENAWNGEVAGEFAGGMGTETDPYIIANADQLAYLGNKISNDNDNYGGKHYKLIADINIGGVEKYNSDGRNVLFYPIGYNKVGGTTTDKGNWYTYGGSFKGVFDGAGHTVSGIYQNTWAMVGDYSGTYYNDAMGLFGYVNGGTVKNLTIDNFYSEGEFAPTGCVAAYAAGKATFENIAITNSHPQTYNTGVAGIVGWDNGGDTEADASEFTFKNITVNRSNTISALWGSWDVAAAGLLGYLGKYSTANLINCNVSATIDVYNDVCGNYQYYWYRYCGMLIGTVDKTNDDGSLDLSNIKATNCTVDFGDRHEYYYCEFIDNTIASYTHDYQFSRVDHGDLDFDQTPVVCTHKHSDKKEIIGGETVLVEDKRAVYIPFRQIFGGYGWGVDGKEIVELLDIQDVTRKSEPDANDQVKFETKFTGDFLYRVGNQNTVSVGNLFEYKETAKENGSGVVVTVDKVDENSNVSGTFTAATGDWTKGTIQFSGTGVVKVTIQDYDYCTPTELMLEVVDAVNATTATSATKNNVVLLNDCGFSSVEVSGGYTLYGNGFTMTCSSDSASLSFGEFVKLDSGTLDNVQIVCPNYDYAALYNSQLKSDSNRVATTNGTTRYYNAKSAVVASGNSQILNSRISGGRAALYASNGNVVVDNSRLEGGAVATVIISAANSFVFRDATLIQKPTVSTYDSNKTLMGMSVLYLCDADGNATPTNLEGSFVQNAWVDSSCTDYMPEGTSSIASTVLGKNQYTHEINGKNCVNLGFAYMPNDGTTVNEPSNISDYRTDKETVPYAYENVKASVPAGGLTVNIDTYVYSYKNTSGTNDSFNNDQDYEPDKYSDIIEVSYADTQEGLTSGKSYGTNGWVYELNVDLDKLSGYVLDFSKLSMSVNGRVISEYEVNGGDKPNIPVEVTAGSTTYMLTTTVDGKDFSISYVVTGVETSKEAPTLIKAEWACADHVTGQSGMDSVYSVTAKVLEGLTIKYWSVKNGEYVELELSDLTPTDREGKINGKNNSWSVSGTDNDFTLTVSSLSYVHTNNKLYAMPVVYNKSMYFVVSDATGMVKTTNSAREMTITYVFKDNNGGELTFNHKWSGDNEAGEAITYSDITSAGNSSSGSNCVTPDTLITLADGTQVRVDSLTGNEQLLVWNLETGKYGTAPIVFVDSEEESAYEITHLYFSDGSDVKVIYEHGFFDLDLGEYVYIDVENYADYVGHRFVTEGDIKSNKWNVATLDNVVIETEVTTAWSPVTYEHLCYYTNGVLSMPGGIEGLFNIFEVDTETMRYDAEQMQQDIETYGLFTIEDFGGMITEDAFNAFNGAYLKVAMGKGLLTWEDIAYMAERYIPLM